MDNMCTDNRFELIEKYKKELIESTNIETSQDEMAVLDNLLFRFWQIGWLDRLEQPERKTVEWIPCSERLPEERGLYLTTTKDKAVYCDYWNEDNFDRTEMVIAWMSLPEPYKGEES